MKSFVFCDYTDFSPAASEQDKTHEDYEGPFKKDLREDVWGLFTFQMLQTIELFL